MRRFVSTAALIAFATLSAPRPAHAQLGGLSIGAAAGIANPTGNVSPDFNSGYHIEGLAALSLPLVPLGFRGEVAYDHLNPKTTPNSNALKIASGVVDATFSLPFPLVHPYAIAGVGYYIHNGSAGIGSREGKVGLNGGLGVQVNVLLLHAFAEARYHTVSYDQARVAMIPITVGITF